MTAATTTIGHALSAADWLDTHYLAGQADYDAMLRRASLQTGWHVLDAGCGGGSFLPLMSALLGPAGAISAIDLAPENVAQVAARSAAGEFLCPVDVRTGDVTALPYADAAFDAVWSANVTQYLSDNVLRDMLCEARRVLKPGGLLALKETEDSAFRLHPLPPLLLWRLFDALAQAGEMTIIGGLRGLHLPQFVRQAGFVQVQCSVTTIERWAPLRPVETALVAELVAWLADKAETLALPAGDLAQWRTLADPAAPGYLLRQPDLYWREADVLVTGYIH